MGSADSFAPELLSISASSTCCKAVSKAASCAASPISPSKTPPSISSSSSSSSSVSESRSSSSSESSSSSSPPSASLSFSCGRWVLSVSSCRKVHFLNVFKTKYQRFSRYAAMCPDRWLWNGIGFPTVHSSPQRILPTLYWMISTAPSHSPFGFQQIISFVST